MSQKEFSVRLYVENDLAKNAGIALDKPQTHYLGTVMRRQVGDHVAIFNGRDGEWKAEIQEIRKSHTLLNPVEQLKPQNAEPNIKLLFAPVKKIQNAIIVQKATELGASELVPVLTQRTNSDRIRADKMELQVIEAAEQCERLTVPVVSSPVKLKAAIQALEEDRILFFCHERSDSSSPIQVLQKAKGADKFAILVGPEGGFTEEERDFLSECDNAHILPLGPRILRAETAVAASLSLLQAVHGDWD